MSSKLFKLPILLGLLLASPLALPAAEQEPVAGTPVQTVHFRLDAIELDPPGAAVLEMVAADYASARPARVVVVGYAAPDEGGRRAGAAYAQGVSERRAGSVRNYLYKHGVPLSKITVRGRGLALPASGAEPAARRCAEIFFEKN